MCTCRGSCTGATWWNDIQKTLLVLGAMMDLIGVFLLTFINQTIAIGVLFIVTGSAILILYLLARVPSVVRYFKKLQSPPRMRRAEDRSTQESSPRQNNSDWGNAVYDVPAYEEVVGQTNQPFPSIWTTGDPYDKPPPYSAAIMVSETLGAEGTAPQLAVSLDGVAQAVVETPPEVLRRDQDTVTGPSQVLRVLKPRKQLKLNCSRQELGTAQEGAGQEEPQTPPPSYEDAVDDDVFYPVEWDPSAGPGQTEGV